MNGIPKTGDLFGTIPRIPLPVFTEMYLHCSHKLLEHAMLADPLGAGV
jgi:hypothetical protein|tara:strand:- start:241 stop:384 length:144 start_codon:yes stop_codon:yes gene_type:complete